MGDWLKTIEPERWMATNVQTLDYDDMPEQEKSQYRAEVTKLRIPSVD